MVEQEDGSSASVEKKETNMDNDTKKILLMIARALQMSASAELAKIGGLGLLKKAVQDDVLVAEELLMKINEAEKNNV